MSDRQLAYAVMDSIEHMTGSVPHKVRMWPYVLGLVVFFAFVIALAFAA